MDIVTLLKSFRWGTLQKMYGCAHSSIIGFVSTEWINQSENHSIFDGAPSPITGNGRRNQTNADILLCKDDRPLLVVEVETNVDKYNEKLHTLLTYLNPAAGLTGIEFGLLIMSNLTKGERKYQHCWDSIKQNVGDNNIALISINKKKANLKKDSTLSLLRKRNDYYPWNIDKIEYWIKKRGVGNPLIGSLI